MAVWIVCVRGYRLGAGADGLRLGRRAPLRQSYTSSHDPPRKDRARSPIRPPGDLLRRVCRAKYRPHRPRLRETPCIRAFRAVDTVVFHRPRTRLHRPPRTDRGREADGTGPMRGLLLAPEWSAGLIRLALPPLPG